MAGSLVRVVRCDLLGTSACPRSSLEAVGLDGIVSVAGFGKQTLCECTVADGQMVLNVPESTFPYCVVSRYGEVFRAGGLFSSQSRM